MPPICFIMGPISMEPLPACMCSIMWAIISCWSFAMPSIIVRRWVTYPPCDHRTVPSMTETKGKEPENSNRPTSTRNEAGMYSSLVVCALPNVPDPNRIVTPADTFVS